MADDKKIVIDVEVDAGDADKELKSIASSTEEIKDNAEGMGASMKDGFDAAGKGAKNASKGIKTATSGIGDMIKAMGVVGIALQVFAFLKELLMKNQKVMDVLNTATVAFEIIVKTLGEKIMGLVEPMKAVFENPKQAVKDLGEAIKKNLINRFDGLMLAATAVAKTFTAVFEADWEGVAEGVKDYGQALIQVGTGLDKEQQAAIVDGVVEFAKETAKATVSAVKQADALVQLRNEIQLLEAEQRKQILVSQNLAELERQKRDDISLTIEERVKANDKLAEILDEQSEIETGIANKRIELKQRELALNPSSIEAQVALKDAETELADVRERINGQRSEQLTNEKALEKELYDFQQELRTVGKSDRELEMEELMVEMDRLAEIKRLAGDTSIDITAETNRRIKEIEDAWRAEDLAAQKKYEDKKLKEQEKVDRARVGAAQGVAGALTQIGAAMQAAGLENQAFQKALAIGEIAINAAIATAAAIKNATQSSATVWDMIANIAVAVGTVAGAIASAVTILNQADGPPAPTMNVDAGTSAPSVAPSAVSTQSTELGNAQGAMLAPIQAFVVETEMTGSQSNISQIENQVTFGIDG